MEVTLSETVVRVVSLDGLQAKWQIAIEDQVVVEDEIFVKLCTGNKQLCNLVWEDNHDAPTPERNKHTSLTTSIGWQQLIKLRNEKQSQQFSGCSLFENTTKPKKKPRMSRGEIKSKRSEFQVIEVDLNGANIKMLRPVHPKDTAAVLYDSSTLAVVLNYLRDNGFEKREPNMKRGAGIHKRKVRGIDKGFVVMKQEEGKKKYKHVETLDAAMQVAASGFFDDEHGPPPCLSVRRREPEEDQEEDHEEDHGEDHGGEQLSADESHVGSGHESQSHEQLSEGGGMEQLSEGADGHGEDHEQFSEGGGIESHVGFDDESQSD